MCPPADDAKKEKKGRWTYVCQHRCSGFILAARPQCTQEQKDELDGVVFSGVYDDEQWAVVRCGRACASNKGHLGKHSCVIHGNNNQALTFVADISGFEVETTWRS